MKSSTYALTGHDNIVIMKGSAKDMHRLRKKANVNAKGYRVWNAPNSKVGDKLR